MEVEADLYGLFNDNSSYDYYEYDYKQNACHPSTISGALGVFISLLYSTGLLWGLLVNGLVLVILCRKRLNHSVMDIFILHLCLADSLLLLTLPLWAVDAVKGWIMGTGLCKLAGALFKINFYCGIFLLVCLSVNCYRPIVCGMKTFSNKRPLVVHGCCLMVWLLCVLLSIPEWLYLKSVPVLSKHIECILDYPPDSFRLASRVPYLVSLAVATLLLLFVCTSVVLKLRQDSRCQQWKTDRRTPVTAVLLLGFFLFWTPYSITFIVNTAHPEVFSSAGVDECDGRQWTASKITAIFGLLHCVINPVIYFCLSKEFRRRTLNMLHACEKNSDNGSLWESGGVAGNAPVQEEQGSLQPMNGSKSKMQTQEPDV